MRGAKHGRAAGASGSGGAAEHVRFALPLPPNVANARGHWAKRRRQIRQWEEHAYAAVYAQGVRWPDEPWPRARIACAFFVHQPMDLDGLAARQKPVFDFLKARSVVIARGKAMPEKGFFVDDSPDHLDVAPPTQAVDRKRQRVEVTIERLPHPALSTPQTEETR